MNSHDQRLAILTHLGWTDLTRQGRRGTDGPVAALRGTTPDGRKDMIPPNHLLNLNAMREVQEVLTREQHRRYRKHLSKVCHGLESQMINSMKITSASAAQHLEACLKTLDLWTTSSSE